MGSAKIQGELWGKRPKDWSAIQEQTSNTSYHYVLERVKLTHGVKLLDVGCGSGVFCAMAAGAGAHITGFDATEGLLEEARERAPAVTFVSGDMEELPFGDEAFDVVCGFNSFQYAADVKNALSQARRVLKPGGTLVCMIWGNREDCEAATYLKAVGSMMPAPPPGAPGPFGLSENGMLENLVTDAGFKITESTDVPATWDYPDEETAIKGLISAGPAARAIGHSGYEPVHAAVKTAVQPYLQSNGHVVYHNKFRVVMGVK